ncbi:MAG: chorismate synthase [Pseudomonadota bacterium]
MGSTFGRFFRVTTFGESHGPALGVTIDGVPAGLVIDEGFIQRELDRRRPGTSDFVSPRREPDQVEILSGISSGRSLGSPIALLIRNKDARSQDYSTIRDLFRPGHADYTYFKKYGLPPQPGGGRASGRETVGRTAAGAVAKILIGRHGMTVRSCTVQIAGVKARKRDFEFAERNPLRCPDPDAAEAMADEVKRAGGEGDSVGGIVEVIIEGMPPGLGDPVFDKLDGLLAGAMVSIGAVKGIEFGTGFGLAAMRGSEANDPISSQGFLSNHAGGTLGGISTGQPIVMRLVVKPTASIAKPRPTVDLHGNDATIMVKGRHDPCLCPRIGPVAEAMASLVSADALLARFAELGGETCELHA